MYFIFEFCERLREAPAVFELIIPKSKLFDTIFFLYILGANTAWQASGNFLCLGAIFAFLN